MTYAEIPVLFDCQGERLVGVMCVTAQPMDLAVLIVVGGPQYRSGSHRQFTLLARHMADRGIPSLRFDYRGMGDSEGEMRNFESVHDDIRAAVDVMFNQLPSLRQVVIWGLCDAASAALFYAPTDTRVRGIALLNPWAHTEAGAAKTRLRYYYARRLLDKEFMRKLARRQFNFSASIRELVESLRKAAGMKIRKDTTDTMMPIRDLSPGLDLTPLPDRMLAGAQRFRGDILLILSGEDLTAQEFKTLRIVDRGWRGWLKSRRVSSRELAEANHTFSRAEWRNQVERWTSDWLFAQHDNHPEAGAQSASSHNGMES